MIDFDRLQELAADIRFYIHTSPDQAKALKSVVSAFDLVLGIYPEGDEMGLHVIKGDELLLDRANGPTEYSHTAIALQSREQALCLQTLLA